MSKRIKCALSTSIIWLVVSVIILALVGVENFFSTALYGAIAAFSATLTGYDCAKKDKD